MAAAAAAASSSSSNSGPMPPWILLKRFALVRDDAEYDEPEEAGVKISCSRTPSTLSVARSVHPHRDKCDRHPYVVAYDAEYDKPEDARVKLSCSPTPSTLSVPRSIHPHRDLCDRHPYVVAYDAEGLLLHIYASDLNFCANPAGSFLVLPLRDFIPAIPNELVMSAAAVIRVPERLNVPAVGAISNVGLLSRLGCHGMEFLVAELQSIDDDAEATAAKLLRFHSGSVKWVEDKVRCIGFNPWCAHEVVSHDAMLWWVDLGKGLISCNPFVDNPVMIYQALPDGVTRRVEQGEASWIETEKRRCVTVSSGMLRFLEVRDAAGEIAIIIWTLVCDPENRSMSWLREFKINMRKIWSPESSFPQEMPILATMHPEKAKIIYLFADGKLVSVDVAQNEVVEIIKDISPLSLLGDWNGAIEPPPLSSRYLFALKLGTLVPIPPSADQLASVLPDPRHGRALARICRQGAEAAQILAYELGNGVSTVGSNLLYLKEECNDATRFFKYMGEFKPVGRGYVASMSRKSTKVSKWAGKLLGGTTTALSYGGRACSSLGFALQKMHPEAQVGGSASAMTETVMVKSVEEAEKVIQNWVETQDHVIVDVPPEMETSLAEEILKVFKDGGAMNLIEKSPVLREKAVRLIDDITDWHMV